MNIIFAVSVDLYNLLDWSQTWQLFFNSSKCSCLHYGNNNQNNTYYMCGSLGKAPTCRKSDILRLSWSLNPYSFMSMTHVILFWISFYWHFYNGFLKCQTIIFYGNIKLIIHNRSINNILDYFNVFRYKITRQRVQELLVCKSSNT